ncbi:hypothetical protein LCGC14_0361960 [marine sediment metagenome]|uniref:Uncharacterized protein n=1 Tax=marine sediment metagenome TaxID=412755 RepID=A0A0F9WFV4_9ZZZZ
MPNDLTQFVREGWALSAIRQIKTDIVAWAYLVSTSYDQGDMTDLEFRLFHGTPGQTRRHAAQQAPLRGNGLFSNQQQARPPMPQPVPRPRKTVESRVVEPRMLNA